MKAKRLLFLTIMALCATSAWAYTFSAVAPSGQTLYYNLVTGGVSVTYPGSDYSGPTGNLTIPSTVSYEGYTYSVTSIGNEAFYGCIGLTSVTIPNSVTSIGDDAFSRCSGLTSVTIPSSVTSIGSYAFSFVRHIEYYGSASGSPWGAISMNGFMEGDFVYSDSTKHYLVVYAGMGGSVTVPSSVDTIGNEAFYDCRGLTSVTIPNSVTSIGYSAFYNCNSLTSVTIGNSVTSIGNSAFLNCIGLTSVTIPNSVTSIGDWAFCDCTGLTSVTIGNSVTSIGGYAFSGCTGLTSVTIPNSVTRIGGYAFLGCTGLTSVTIPNSVTRIGNDAFRGCTGLTSVFFNADSCAGFNSNYDYHPFYSCPNITSFTFGNNVRVIPAFICYNMTGLTSVTIPDSVTSIGSSAFNGCTGLTNVELGNKVEDMSHAFYGCTHLTTIRSHAEYPPICDEHTFEGVPNYADIIVPCGAAYRYQLSDYWMNFSRITEDCSGIDDAEVDGIRVWTENGQIKVEGADGLILHVFDMEGRQIANNNIPSGVYLVKIGNHPARKVVVVR